MTAKIDNRGFIICPSCWQSTTIKVLPQTVLKSFPLYCKHCKKINVIDYIRA